jgi:hypothetical protein
LKRFQQNTGNLALFYSLGAAKYHTKQRVVNLLEDIFKENVRTINLAVLYGSRKPYSDMDLLIVSDNIKSYTNKWLDIYAIPKANFEDMTKNFDISIVQPLMTGELIMGERDYFINKKEQLKNQKITLEAIKYNISKAKEQAHLSKFEAKPQDYYKGIGYLKTYSRNALSLSNGKRTFTL